MKYFIKNRETGFLFLFFAPDFLDSIILTKNKKILNISGKEGEKIMANTIKKAIQEGLEVKYVTKSTVLGEGWGVVITTKDGEEFSPFYPFGTFEGVREFTRSNKDVTEYYSDKLPKLEKLVKDKLGDNAKLVVYGTPEFDDQMKSVQLVDLAPQYRIQRI